jgi:uncharacterized phage protein (TIGR02216 family)
MTSEVVTPWRNYHMADGFPWRDVMAFGLGRLHLAPRDFWAMTPRELAAAAEGMGGPRLAPPARAALEALMQRYPDQPDGTRPSHD